MKKLILLLSMYMLLSTPALASDYIERTIDGYKFQVLKIDVRNKDFTFKIGVNPDYSASSLRQIMEKNNGISAINGAFMCPADYRECGGQNFTKNERYYKGFKIATTPTTEDRVVFAVDREGKPFIFQTDKIYSGSEGRIYYGISNFPLLLRDGKSTYNDYLELGLIDSKMKAKMSRNFICHDSARKYIFAGYVSAIELEKLPNILLELGCYNALNLDAGASSSFIYNARQIKGPGREILDAIVIERNGLDTSLIITSTEGTIEKVKNKLTSSTYNERSLFIGNVTGALAKMRSDTYDKYSYNTFGEDGQIDGYRIYIKDLGVLTRLYLFNYLEYSLNELKKEYKQEEDARLQFEKDENNKKSGLF